MYVNQKSSGFFSRSKNKPQKEYAAHKARISSGDLDRSNIDDYAKKKIEYYLKSAAHKYRIDPAVFENTDLLLKCLRMPGHKPENSGETWANPSEEKLEKWKEWSLKIFSQLKSGAFELLESIHHWKQEMSSKNSKCEVTRIQLTGSDLHGRGLGAAIVEFSKVQGEGKIFKNEDKVKVVIKPEDRNIEKSLFGSHGDSFANWVNEFAGLKGNRIRTLDMETHEKYGSIIEFIDGTQAKAFGTNNAQAYKKGMSEAIVFSFLAGLTDLHQENIIWSGRKGRNPYMIDADNALNLTAMNTPSLQSGFSKYNRNETQTEINYINNNPQNSRSRILKQVYKEPDKFFEMLKKTFVGKKGRIVPRRTTFWGNNISEYIYDKKNYDDITIPLYASNLPDAFDGHPGLKGECGEHSLGGSYNEKEETKQIREDFKKGQIPFYSYDFETGWVYHNGKKIWRGRSIDDAITDLRAKLGL